MLGFTEISGTNDWTEGETLLYFWEALKDEAKNCGRVVAIPEEFKTMEAQYGIFPGSMERAQHPLERGMNLFVGMCCVGTELDWSGMH